MSSFILSARFPFVFIVLAAPSVNAGQIRRFIEIKINYPVAAAESQSSLGIIGEDNRLIFSQLYCCADWLSMLLPRGRLDKGTEH